MQLQVKQEFEWEKIGSFQRADPWCIAFVYPPNDPGFIVKGGRTNVRNWIEGNVHMALVHYTFYLGGKTRTMMDVLVTSVPWMKVYFQNVHRVNGKKQDKTYTLTVYDTRKDKRDNCVLRHQTRRPPRCWPKELDAVLFPKEPVKPKIKGICDFCEKATRNVDGEVTGCLMTAFPKNGDNCPLNEEEKAKIAKLVPKITSIPEYKRAINSEDWDADEQLDFGGDKKEFEIDLQMDFAGLDDVAHADRIDSAISLSDFLDKNSERLGRFNNLSIIEPTGYYRTFWKTETKRNIENIKKNTYLIKNEFPPKNSSDF
jgi:hypothetical protein